MPRPTTMIDIFSHIAHIYPGWTLFVLLLLVGGAISAIPATAAALRGPRSKGS